MAIKNKKGMFFTLIAIIMVIAIILFFTPNYEYLPQMSQIPTKIVRVTKANNLMRNFKTTLVERELQSSSYYAVKQLLQCIDNQSMFSDDLQADFAEILLNGTLNGGDLATECGIDYMTGRNLPLRLNELRNVSEKELHLFTNFSVLNITIYQSNETGFDSFAVDLNLNIKMDAGLAGWDTNTTITTTHEVEGFDDPYYLANANFTNKINFSNITNWTTSLVFDHIDAMHYVFEEQAPSFLMRFENNNNKSSCCGIESLINPYDLNISDEPWSYVDYCFYGHECNDSRSGNKSLWNITGISSGNETERFYMFKLEIYHIDKYDLAPDDRVVCEGSCP